MNQHLWSDTHQRVDFSLRLRFHFKDIWVVTIEQVVGGFTPSEKYESRLGVLFPTERNKKKVCKGHLPVTTKHDKGVWLCQKTWPFHAFSAESLRFGVPKGASVRSLQDVHQNGETMTRVRLLEGHACRSPKKACRESCTRIIYIYIYVCIYIYIHKCICVSFHSYL